MRSLLCLCALLASSALASTQVIQGETHGDTFIAPAINAVLGSGHIDTDIFVDSTGTVAASLLDLPQSMLNTGAPYIQVATGNPANHAPYPVAGLSKCAWTPQQEQLQYATMQSAGQLIAMAYGAITCGTQPAGTAPGVLLSTASSSNSFNGGTAPGIEFALSPSYLGLDTSADSWITAELAGFLVSLEWQHPTWNPFDIKAALRQTAANWATGYDATHFGYGVINYSSATAVASPSAMYLQPPGLSVVNHGYYAALTLYPFRQTRRVREAIYSVNASYAWPVKNEYTAADITASGATLLYTSNGTDVTPTYSFVPVANGTVTFVTFTLDGAGGYSRVEPFTKQAATLTVSVLCNQ